MKTFFQIVGLIIILIGGFWVGMQWGSLESASHGPIQPTYTSDTPRSSVPAPAEVWPSTQAPTPEKSVTTEPVATPSVTPTTETTPEQPSTTTTPASLDLPVSKNDKVNHYENTNYGYSFDIPANLYYSGFGGANGAKHTVGISKEVPETLDTSAVRVYFYGKKILPELQNASTYEDPAGKYLLVLVGGQYSVRIEANDIKSPIVAKIAQTLTVQ